MAAMEIKKAWNKTVIIGITGLKGSGKDTAALALVAYKGYHLVKFADGLKIMMRALLKYAGIKPELVEEAIEGEHKETLMQVLDWRSPRYAMQTLGTEWGRNLISENLWVRICETRCRQFDDVVISDVRFPNEVKMIQYQGGKIIRISRPNFVNNDTHPSESLFLSLPSDYEIINDGSIEDLQDQILNYERTI